MPPKSRRSVSESGELTVVRPLPCPLSEEDFATKGKELAGLLQDITQAEEEKKASVADATARIKEMRAAASELKDTISRGTEDREVECVWKKNKPEPGMKSLVRLDTKEVVEKQDMNLLDGGAETPQSPINAPE